MSKDIYNCFNRIAIIKECDKMADKLRENLKRNQEELNRQLDMDNTEKIREMLEEYRQLCLEFAKENHHNNRPRSDVKFWEDKAKLIISLLPYKPCRWGLTSEDRKPSISESCDEYTTADVYKCPDCQHHTPGKVTDRSNPSELELEFAKEVNENEKDKQDAMKRVSMFPHGQQKKPDNKAEVFDCKHFIGRYDFVPVPFGSGTCSMPSGDCRIESESEDCSVNCPDYQKPVDNVSEFVEGI